MKKTKLVAGTPRLPSYTQQALAAIASAVDDKKFSGSLSALIGENGHAQVQLRSDAVRNTRAIVALTGLLMKLKLANPHLHWRRIQVFDDRGLCSLEAPIVYNRAVANAFVEPFRKLKLDALVQGHTNLLTTDNDDAEQIVSFSRALTWTTDPQTDDTLKRLLATENRNSKCVANSLSIGSIKLDDAEASARWLLALPKVPLQSREKAGERELVPSEKPAAPELVLRLIECLSQNESKTSFLGLGAGKQLRADLFKELDPWQAGREKIGMIIDENTDIWELWFELRRAQGVDQLAPFRFDNALSPPTQKRKKSGRRPQHSRKNKKKRRTQRRAANNGE